MRILLQGTICTLSLLSTTLSWAAAPTANNDFRTISVGSSVTINALNNDSDPDGDIIKITSIGAPSSGTASLRSTDSAIIYTPEANFKGQVSLTYTLEDIPTADAAPQQTTGTVVINVVAFAGSNDTGNSQTAGAALVKACDFVGLANSANLAEGPLALKQRCEGLVYLQINNPGGIDEVVRQIAPEETLALSKAASAATQAVTGALDKRLSSLAGKNSFTLNNRQWDQQNTGAAAGDDLRSSPWSMFATVQIETADKDRTILENGFTSSANSVLAGVDYQFNSDWVLGVGAAIGQNDMDFLNGDGTVSSDTQSLLFYNLVNFSALSWDVQVGLSSSSYDINRRIHYKDNIDNQFVSAATTSGEQVFVSTSLQYQYAKKALSISPSLKIGISQSTLDAYGENNLGGYEVTIGEQKEQQTKIEAGLQGQYAFNFNWGVLMPTAGATFISQTSSSRDNVSGTFAYGAPGDATFVMTPEEFDTSYYLVNLGTSAVLPNGFSLFLTAQQLMGYDNFSSQQYSLGGRMEF